MVFDRRDSGEIYSMDASAFLILSNDFASFYRVKQAVDCDSVRDV